ncbi:MAG: hypothetical protein QOI06_2885 [Nocardioidaceae bacterium]|jgi:uncharacterized protein (DUF1501 family)|nr:hypothetical protein [Nocardioidaceae bacterium]
MREETNTMTGTHVHPGCDEFKRTTGSRRNFLKGLGVVTAGGVMATMHGTVFKQTAFAASGQASNILVVLSQRGGADGMSLVVPYGDPNYKVARPTIGIPPGQLLQTDGFFGLHPRLAPLEQMWSKGQMAAVHATGLKVANRSHFSAIVELEEANTGSTQRIGWLNRMIGMNDPGSLFGAVQVGNGVPETEVYGSQATLSAQDVGLVQVYGPSNAMPQRVASLNSTWNGASGPLGKAGRDAMDTAVEWAPVLRVSTAPQNGANYPGTDLGDALAQSARVIRGNVGAEVITIDHSSWDMHTGLGTLDDGDMRLMADDLAKSIAAFFTDLGALADNVTMVTISEFGRRVIENGDAGLDHGWGNAMLLLGAGVKGGTVYSKWPGLDLTAGAEADLSVTTDYRSVLYEVVKTQFPNVSLPSMFPGLSYNRVGVMQGA